MKKQEWDDITRTAHIAAREGYEVNVWIDDPKNLFFVKEEKSADQKSPKTYGRFFNETYDLYVNKLKTIRIRNIDEMRSASPSFLTEKAYQKYWEYMDLETVGLKNNAAFSDLLRYAILDSEGGIYFNASISPLIFPRDRETYLGEISLPIGFQHIEDNNTIILSSLGNPIISECMIKGLRNYLKAEETFGKSPPFTEIDRKRFHSVPLRSSIQNTDRYELTVKLSGPKLVKETKKDFLQRIGEVIFPDRISVPLKLFRDLKHEIYGKYLRGRPSLQKAFLEIQKMKETNSTVLQSHVLPAGMTWEEYQEDLRVHGEKGHLKMFASYYFNITEEIEELPPEFLAKIEKLFESLNKTIERPLVPVKIGKSFFVEYKCGQSWYGSKNPSSFSTDDLRF